MEWRNSWLDQLRDRDYAEVAPLALEDLTRCEASIRAGLAVSGNQEACFKSFRTFLLFYRDYPDMQAYNLPPQKVDPYLESARATHPRAAELPTELVNHPEFLRLTTVDLPAAAKRPEKLAEVLDGIQALLKRLNPQALAATYNSRHFAGPGMAASDLGRLVIYYPGKDVDRWIQLGIPREGPPSSNLSFISVVKQDSQGEALSPAQAFYQDFLRVEGNPTAFESRQKKEGKPLDCVSCHFSGPNVIVPSAQDAVSAKNPIAAMNTAMATYGAPTSPGLGRRDEQGLPLLGQKLERPTAWIEACAKSVSPSLGAASFKKVAQSMDCAQCHNGSTRGRLLSAPPGKGKKTLRNYLESMVIEARAMPPGAELNREERAALVNCLMADVSKLNSAGKDSPMLERVRKAGCELDPAQVQSTRPGKVGMPSDPIPKVVPLQPPGSAPAP